MTVLRYKKVVYLFGNVSKVVYDSEGGPSRKHKRRYHFITIVYITKLRSTCMLVLDTVQSCKH